jgi:hypothetical protein
MSKFSMDDYVDVAERLIEFREKHPEGSLQPVDPANPFEIREVGNKVFIVYTAAAYRTPDDPRPGIGTAWEPFPGPTPYTKDSELMNAETSAWGRAILAVLAADSRRGVASAQEVRNRSNNHSGGGKKGKAKDVMPYDLDGFDKGTPFADVDTETLRKLWKRSDPSDEKWGKLNASRRKTIEAVMAAREGATDAAPEQDAIPFG